MEKKILEMKKLIFHRAVDADVCDMLRFVSMKIGPVALKINVLRLISGTEAVAVVVLSNSSSRGKVNNFIWRMARQDNSCYSSTTRNL